METWRPRVEFKSFNPNQSQYSFFSTSITYSHIHISPAPIKVTMKFFSLLFSTLSLVAVSQAAAVVAERDMATQHAGVCPAVTAQVGKTKGYHDE
jgi:hypothetical protein